MRERGHIRRGSPDGGLAEAAWPRLRAGVTGAVAALLLLLPARCVAEGCWCQTAGAIATVTSGFVTGVTVTDRGCGYSVPPEVTFVGGGGSGAAATAWISDGGVTEITMTDAGHGYSSTPTVQIEPPCFDLGDSLVGYWPFQGSAVDFSTNNPRANGVNHGGTFTVGKVGIAIYLDGNSYVDFGDPADGRFDIAPGQDCTIAMWIKTGMSGNADWPMLLSKDSYCSGVYRRGWEMFFNTGGGGGPINGQLEWGNGNDAGVGTSAPVNDNQWHHVVAAKRGGTLTMYIDGSVADTFSGSEAAWSAYPVSMILGWNQGCFSHYIGYVDEVRFYKRALQPREIKALYRCLPVISQQPQDVSIPWGGIGGFTVSATGDGPFTFQLYKDGDLMPGLTSTGSTSGMTFRGDFGEAGLYSAAITGPSGTVYSRQAKLTVTLPHYDVGDVGAAGTASESNGVFTVQGSGSAIGDGADSFQFASQPVSGDFQIAGRLLSLQGPPLAEAGLMIRHTFDAGSAHVFLRLNAATNIVFCRRLAYDTIDTPCPGAGCNWLRLMRMGDTFVGLSSSNGVDWQYDWFTTIKMADPAQVGLAVTSNHRGVLATAGFDHVSVGPLTTVSGPLTFYLGGEPMGTNGFQPLGGFKVLLGGDPGDWVRMYESSVLPEFTPLGDYTNALGLMEFLDPGALTNQTHFYRAQRLGP